MLRSVDLRAVVSAALLTAVGCSAADSDVGAAPPGLAGPPPTAGVDSSTPPPDTPPPESGDAGQAPLPDSGPPEDNGAGPVDSGSLDSTGDAPARTQRLGASVTHTCAVRAAGVYCWGENFSGQLGVGDNTRRMEPVQALDATFGIVEVAVSQGRTCARRQDGGLLCWGENAMGQAGDGTVQPALAPREVTLLGDARQLAVGPRSTCALRANGTVTCWGGVSSADIAGGVQAVPIGNLEDVRELVGSVQDTYCARGGAGWVRCWTLTDEGWSMAREAATLAGAQSIAVVDVDVACGIVGLGTVTCEVLETGLGYPLPLSEGSSRLTGGQLIACSATVDDTWRCWNVLRPMLEDGGSFLLPLPFGDLRPVELSVGGLRACALLPDQVVVCADANDAPLALVEVDGLPD